MKALIKGFINLGNLITVIALLFALYLLPEFWGLTGFAWSLVVILIVLVIHLIWGILSAQKAQNYSSISSALEDIYGDIISFTIHIVSFTIILVLNYKVLEVSNSLTTILLILVVSTFSVGFEMFLTINNAAKALYRLNPINVNGGP